MSFSETLRLSRPVQPGQPFIVSGSRAYLIGSQDGAFPPLGFHLPGEMGGIWAPPTKLFDGIALFVDNEPLPPAEQFTVEAFSASHWHSRADGITVVRDEFVPDDEAAVVVHFAFRAARSRSLHIRVVAWPSLRGVWPLAHSDTEASVDVDFSHEIGAWVCHDAPESRFAIIGCDREPAAHSCGFWSSETPNDHRLSVTFDLALELGTGDEGRLQVVMSGGSDRETASATLTRVLERSTELRKRKTERFQSILSHTTLQAPDSAIQRAWDWTKCNYDWLTLDVPGIGRGTVAGAPDFMWWFGCDSSFGALGQLALGQHDAARHTLDLIRVFSERAHPASPHVIHEANLRGEVVGPGMVEESPLFVSAVWQTYCWTGDLDFLRKQYAFCCAALLDWTIGEHCPDGSLLPRGYGITEIADFDLQCIDSAVFTARALHDLERMADTVGDQETSIKCAELYARARDEVTTGYWLEREGMYGDFRATPIEMIARLDRWLDASEAAGDGVAGSHLRRLLTEARADPEPDVPRPWLCGNWTAVCPLSAELSDPIRATRALGRLHGPEFTAAWGMRIGAVWPSRSVMSINTGELAIAELAYGSTEAALALLRSLADTLDVHMPGAISEYLPDGGCFVQAWSGYAITWPIVAHLFGLKPDAGRKYLTVSPRLASIWPHASLRNIRIGDARFDCEWDGTRLAVTADRPGWMIVSQSAQLEVCVH